MTTEIILKTLFETGLTALGIWMLFNEDKFTVFEEKLISYIRRRRLKIRTSGTSSVSYKVITR